MVDFMRFYGSSYCENYGSVMAGPLPLRASEVSLYGNYDTGHIHTGRNFDNVRSQFRC